jgi:bisphosphoglycerate-independent phosphoglycerate mutase (AlkP superfamily)
MVRSMNINLLHFFQIILDAIEQAGGIFVLTADHGNAEDMAKREKSGKPLRDKDGKVQALTSHTLNPVSALMIKFVAELVLKPSTCRFQSPLEVLGLHPG